ncbi:MAG: hypothetical protein ACREX4_16705 [Gammaproteobacteria bacterium]
MIVFEPGVKVLHHFFPLDALGAFLVKENGRGYRGSFDIHWRGIP